MSASATASASASTATKLRAALLRSTHKRQVCAADVEALVHRVELAIATAGGQLPASRIGELCIEGLRDLDYGAYLQFLGTLPSPHANRILRFRRRRVPSGAAQSASLPLKPASWGMK